MQSAKERKEFDKFLSKVDKFDDIIKGLISTDQGVQQEAIKKADEEIIKEERTCDRKYEKTGFDRTVINKNAYTADENQFTGPTFAEQNTTQEAFLSALETDCQKRTQARKERHHNANKIKEDGNEAFKIGNYSKAIELYTEATTIAKDLTPLYTNRAAAYLKLEQYQEAIDDCEFSLRIDEKWIKAHVFKGKALLKLHKYDDAISEFKKILDLDDKKISFVQGCISGVEEDRRVYELEKIAQLSLKNDQLEAKSIAKVITTIRNRLKDEQEIGAHRSGGLMYFAGGFRVLQTHLSDDQSRTLFRTQNGFKILTDAGSVSKCLKSRLHGKSNKIPPHGSELVSAVMCLCTAACVQSPENVKALLGEPEICKMFLNFFVWPDDQVKRDTITFFHEVSLEEMNRLTLYERVDCKSLAAMLLKPNTRKADANSSAAATLCNLSLDKRFKMLQQSDFASSLLPLFYNYLEEVGTSSYEALTLRMRFLVQLADDQCIANVLSSDSKFTKSCTEALGRCVACFKRGLTNPCAMEELLRLLAIVLRRKHEELFCQQLVLCLIPALKAKDVELLVKSLSVISLALEKNATCVDILLTEVGSTLIKRFFKFVKQTEPRMRTYALKILCCIGQYDSKNLLPLIELDEEYLVMRNILADYSTIVANINQGHIALLLGFLSHLPGGLEPLKKTNMEGEVVRQLLVLFRESKSKQASANCAIALGKMARADQRFLEELRKHDGINILARSKPADAFLG